MVAVPVNSYRLTFGLALLAYVGGKPGSSRAALLRGGRANVGASCSARGAPTWAPERPGAYVGRKGYLTYVGGS